MTESEAKEKQEEQTETPEGVTFGFLVLKTDDGNVIAKPVEESGIPAPPSMDDIYGACNQINKQIEAQQIAQTVASSMVQAAQQAQQQSAGKLVIPK